MDATTTRRNNRPAIQKGAGEYGQVASVLLENVEDEDGATRTIIRGGLQQMLGEEDVPSHAGDSRKCSRSADNGFSSRVVGSRSNRLT